MKKNVFVKQLLIDFGTLIIGYIICELLIGIGVLNGYWQTIAVNICINVILTVSLNLTSGYLGELALGHAGFMAIGAYASAFFTKTLRLVAVVEFPLAILVGGILAGIAGLIVSIPTLRLRGDYLAIITLAFGEIVRNILVNLEIVGGASGYSAIPNYTTFTWAFALAGITVLVIKSLIRSRQGRSIISIREDEIASESSGVDTNHYKQLVFIISAFFAGIGGALYAHQMSFLQPGVFTLDKSIEILVMVVLGGMGNITGSIISAGVLTLLPELLRSLSQLRMLIYAIVLIVVMISKHSSFVQNLFQKTKSKKEAES